MPSSVCPPRYRSVLASLTLLLAFAFSASAQNPPDVSFRMAFSNDGKLTWVDYTAAGPVHGGNLFRGLPVVGDNGGRYFYGNAWQEFFKVDSQTSSQQSIRPNLNTDFSWTVGTTFDLKRNRILAATLAGEGFLFSYLPDQNTWSLVASLQNNDFDSLVYHAPDDALYALTGLYSGGRPRLYRLSSTGAIGESIQLPELPFGIGPSGYHSELVSAGDYIVVLLEPDQNFHGDGVPSESRIYLVNPKTGDVQLTYQKTFPNQNHPPEVKITLPSPAARFGPAEPVRMIAFATDPEDIIPQRVDFFADGQLIGQGQNAPGDFRSRSMFAFIWTNPSSGPHRLTARATDSAGLSAVSSAVEITVEPPTNPFTVKFLTPLEGSIYDVADDIDFFAITSEQAISVEFFVNGKSIGFGESFPRDSNSPKVMFRREWENIPAGNYSVTARATTESGKIAFTAPLHILVRVGGNEVSVRITSPSEGATFRAGLEIPLVADTGFVPVARVEFFVDGRFIGTGSPVRVVPEGNRSVLIWADPIPGSHSITARAIDAEGDSATSDPVRIAIQPLIPESPLRMIAPINGAVLRAGSNVQIVVAASGRSDIEIFANNRSIGKAKVSAITAGLVSYALMWTNVTTGDYELTAKSIDANGQLISSPITSVKVRIILVDPRAAITSFSDQGQSMTLKFAAPESERFELETAESLNGPWGSIASIPEGRTSGEVQVMVPSERGRTRFYRLKGTTE